MWKYIQNNVSVNVLRCAMSCCTVCRMFYPEYEGVQLEAHRLCRQNYIRTTKLAT